jgi:TnpA family transposase
VISIREARISSSVLLPRLGNEPPQSASKGVRELGRAVRTIVLLRYLSEPEPRDSITTITNRVESFHNFSLGFGNAGIMSDNDSDHMEKIVKFNELFANCAIFYNAVELTSVLNEDSELPPRSGLDLGTR